MRLAVAILLIVISGAIAGEPSRPFPQHVSYAPGCIFPSDSPTKRDAAIAGFYEAWKAHYLHSGCVAGQLYVASNLEGQHDDPKTIAVSEGHGYGMVITALMAGHDSNARAQFDELYAFFRAHPSRLTPNLMSWRQVAGCKDVRGDDDSATDGDMDIGYALLLADAQWGSAGAINYHAEALKVIADIKKGDINMATPSIKLGDWVDAEGKNLNDTRLSDFMINHFRAFQRATGDPVWSALIDRCYAAVDSLQTKAAPMTGLVPDFARKLNTAGPEPARGKFLESKFDGDYNYNSCRFPWRVAVDYLVAGEPRAKVAVEKINAFFIKKTNGDPAAIRAGYRLSGKVINADDVSLAFTAPLAVSAMVDASHQAWLDKLWTQVRSTPITDDAGGYYGNTIKLLSLLVVSGNWWAP